jgi:hypothetical protein
VALGYSVAEAAGLVQVTRDPQRRDTLLRKQSEALKPPLGRDGRMHWLRWALACGAGSGLVVASAIQLIPPRPNVLGWLPPVLMLASGAVWARTPGRRPWWGVAVAAATHVLGALVGFGLAAGVEVSWGPWWRVPLGLVLLPFMMPLQLGQFTLHFLAGAALGWVGWRWSRERPAAG